jgi:phospholipid/cholesterol/gamma-HCH transport system substrate-binding protein
VWVGDPAVIRRITKIQLILFVLMSLVGVSFVAFNYVGLGSQLFGSRTCTVSANFPDSGGIFTNAEVTYRGVTVGKVGDLHLLDYDGSDGQKVRGVRVDLLLKSCSQNKIAADAQAFVSNRSAVGEQYVNIEPSSKDGPFVTNGSVLTKPGKVPLATQVLLKNLDDLVKNIDSAKLNVLVTELGKAFDGRGPDLQALLDAGDKLLERAQQALPETLKLIDNSQTVLQTQLDSGSALQGWAHNLNLLTEQLKNSDADLNSLLTDGPNELDTVRQFLDGNRSDLNLLLANLTSVNQVLVSHLDGIDAILLLYPAVVSGGKTVTPGDGTAHFGLIINADDPPACIAGYGATSKRKPSETGPNRVNTGARCTLPRGSTSNVRGAQNAPGGDPVTTGGGGTVYSRVVPESESTVLVGGIGPNAGLLGDNTWLPLLTGGLH